MISRLGRLGVLSCLMAAVALLNFAGQARAQEADGLTPIFGDGRLTVVAGGFRPGEHVTLTVVIDLNPPRQFTVTADGQGRFRLETGLAVSPGASVELDARGDQGTGVAAITTVPAAPPSRGEPAAPVSSAPDRPPVQAPTGSTAAPAQVPTRLPRTGGPAGPIVLFAAAGLAGLAVLAGRRLTRS